MAVVRWKPLILRKTLKRFQNFSVNCAPKPTPTYHKRPLPSPLVALSSSEGKILFKEALQLGGMESFFALSEQFITQSDPAYCSLSSLAMVLNALNYDPKRVWKGSWRWVSEEMLQCESSKLCCHSIEKVKSNGMDFNEFESLARCHGVSIESQRVTDEWATSHSNLQLFRDLINEVSSSDKAESFLVANFSRKSLGQTGGGHFSPIGGSHPGKDLVLIMDVARFKYPPFWVSIPSLWKAMQEKDKDTGLSRGYFRISINNQSGCEVAGIARVTASMDQSTAALTAEATRT
jgi:glutathione gamma-glutamylcysteinyltransferase